MDAWPSEMRTVKRAQLAQGVEDTTGEPDGEARRGAVKITARRKSLRGCVDISGHFCGA